MSNPINQKDRYLSFKKGICPYCGKEAKLKLSTEKDIGTCKCGVVNTFTFKGRREW